MTDFPTLVRKIDTGNFHEKSADPAMRNQTESGMTLTRARYTRRGRKTFMFALTDMPNSDKETLMEFYEMTVKGGSEAFNWTHPVTGAIHSVRFMMQLECRISGPGQSHRWDTNTIELEEV